MNGKIIVLLILVFFSKENTSVVDYTNQSQWDGNCQTGTQQSPIDINTKTLSFCPNYTLKIKFQCQDTSFNNGVGQAYTISSPDTSFVGINDMIGTTPNIRLYKASQYHFHSPSEHTINGVQYDLQIHHFHTPVDNINGTDSVYTSRFANFSTSSYNNQTLFASVVSYLFYPSDDAKAIDLNFRTDMLGNALINGFQLFGCTTRRFFYHYRGSSTAPPCTETVDWFVYRQPLPLKRSNYQAIKKLINEQKPNARSVQKLNGRKVYMVGDACQIKQAV